MRLRTTRGSVAAYAITVPQNRPVGPHHLEGVRNPAKNPHSIPYRGELLQGFRAKLNASTVIPAKRCVSIAQGRDPACRLHPGSRHSLRSAGMTVWMIDEMARSLKTRNP